MFAWIIGAIEWAVGAIADAAVTIATVIATIWRIITPIFSPLIDGTKWLWSNVVKPAWSWFREHVATLKSLYLDHVKPIIDKVLAVVSTVKRIWRRLIEPIFGFLDVIRQALTLLHLANTAFGRLLDGWINDVEGAINALDRKIEKPLNAILNFLNNILLDVDGFFRYAMIVGSTAKAMNTIARQFWNAQLLSIPDDIHNQLAQLKTGPNAAAALDKWKQFLTTGAGPGAEQVKYAQLQAANLTSGNLEQWNFYGQSAAPLSEGGTPADFE